MEKTGSKCITCGNNITFHYKPMPQWGIEGDLCGDCYGKKLIEYYIAPDRRDVTKK